MKNYVKQLFRTPMQTVFIIILIIIVTIMLVMSGNLWVTSDRLSTAYEDDFITIGTVTQKPDAIQERNEWDAEKRDYLHFRKSVYNRYATEEDLAFSEITYVVEPEKRVYWGSYAPEYVHVDDGQMYSNSEMLVAEFSPLEDCIPNESIKIKITKILGDAKMLEGTIAWFCDHENRYPEELKADKIYVAEISLAPWTHGSRWEETGNLSRDFEYRPNRVTPTLYTPEGKKIEDTLKMQAIYELTEGFYETDAGARLLEISNLLAIYNDTQPVVGTNSTDLLLPFYKGNAWVYEGRYPTREEYEQGSRVCLVPKPFAEKNSLSVGDQVMTHLYYSSNADMVDIDFKIPDGGGYCLFLGSDGKLLAPFEEKAYTIVGLYDYTPTVEGIGREELIVPLRSVDNKTENYVRFGAMSDKNTSFQIENGTIADFLEASTKHGVDNLIYTFYDRGYSTLMEGIRNLKNMSAALFVMGLIAAVILTLQISHIYITKQKKRLSVERLMGMTRKQCCRISLAGILILLLLGTVPGVAVGMAVAEQVDVGEHKEDVEQTDAGVETAEQADAAQTDKTAGSRIDIGEEFSRKYSNLGLAVEADIDLSSQGKTGLPISCAMGALVLLLGMGLSGVRVRSVLKGEPLYLVEDGMAGK